ncbi:MAG: hypothetical protein ACTTJ3_06370 [Treponema sp.]
MKKIFYILAITAVMFTSCNLGKKVEEEHEKKTELTILNQSSISVKDIKYNGLSFAEVNNDKNFVLTAGGRSKISFEGEGKSYIYFSILDIVNNKEVEVRTAEVISVEKGKDITFIITDNTSVVPVGQVTASTILGIIRPARLKLINQTSSTIDNISYCGKIRKDALPKGAFWQADFINNISGKVQFKIWDVKNNTSVDVELKDGISIKIGETKEIAITNKSLVVKDGKTEAIREVLGVSTLNIVNSSKAEISNLKFAGQTKSGMLEKDASWELDFYNSVEEELEFEVQTKYKKFKVKCAEKVSCDKGELKSFAITDNTQVKISEPEKTLTLSDLLGIARLTIVNKSAVDINALVYAGIDVGTVQKNNKKEVFIFDFLNVPDHVRFKIFQAYSGNTVEVRMQEKLAIDKCEDKTILIDNNTVVVNGEKNEMIKTVLGISTITIINNSSIDVSNLKLGTYTKAEALAKDESWEIELYDPLDDVLNFEVLTKYKKFIVKCEEKIKCNKGEVKSFKITDGTQVKIAETEKILKLCNLLDVACLTISNESSATLNDVSYVSFNIGTVEKSGTKKVFIFDFTNVPDSLDFVITRTIGGDAIQFKTLEKVDIAKNKEKTFIIDNNTLMMRDSDDTPYVLGDFLKGEATLIIENKVLDVALFKSLMNTKFGGKDFGKIGDFGWFHIARDERAFQNFDEDINDYITFEVHACIPVRLPFKLSIGQKKICRITDDTDVEVVLCPVLHGKNTIMGQSRKISELRGYAKLEITNSSFTNLVDLKWGDGLYHPTLIKKTRIYEIFSDTDPNSQVTYPLTFKIYSRVSDSFISVRPYLNGKVRTLRTKKGSRAWLEIVSRTPVRREDNGKVVRVESIDEY